MFPCLGELWEAQSLSSLLQRVPQCFSAEVTPQPLRVAVPGGAGLFQQCHLSPELPHRTQIPSCSPLAGHSSSWAPSKGNPSLSRDPATTVTSGNAAEAEGGRGSLQSLG